MTTQLLIKSKDFGVDFSEICTIGRQHLNGSFILFQNLFNRLGYSSSEFDQIMTRDSRYSENFFKKLGASTIDSIDASSYENATLIHDMNLPILDNWKKRYSIVIDSGSLEHIFNFPQAIKNCMEMVKPGGHLIGVTPSNNFLGHGFYQFSPELFYRVFSEENGFRIIKMYLFFSELNSTVFEVSDPLFVKDRVKLKNSKESFLFYIAERIEEKPIFTKTPQQSDYEHILWDNSLVNKIGKKGSNYAKYKKFIPHNIVESLLNVRKNFSHLRLFFNPIGNGNKKYFKKVKLD
ncbi:MULTISPECIES: class I SAM-dependent methyltransferase [Rhodonellum]|nr:MULTISPECIES: class I SAM-dependent methyltransferase [Rhodonellum]